MNNSLVPVSWPVAAAVSSVRTTVVPTASTRRAERIRLQASGSTRYHSPCIRWSATRSTVTGRNVPSPTRSSTRTSSAPAAANRSSRAGVRWRPAVGAATEPGWRANTVWYRSASPSSAWM